MKPKTIKQSTDAAIESLRHGGRAGERDLKEIADTSVVELLKVGLTLEQAESVLKMATIELARISEESRMIPKTPALEVKIKRGKK
jgi:hypothetical protein